MTITERAYSSPLRRVVITGGSSGLGLAIAKRFYSAGAEVSLIARSESKLTSSAESIRSGPGSGRILTAAVDVTNESDIEAAMNRLAGEMGGMDALVNSAGILREGYFETISSQTFREVFEINVIGTVHAVRFALPHLKKTQGRVIIIESMAGLSGVFGYAPYCASKYALVGLSETLYFELRPQGVGVRLVCPPEFDSLMVDALEKTRTPENRVHTLMIPKAPIGEILEATWAAIHSDQFLTIAGRRASQAAFVLRHFPGLLRKFASRAIEPVYVGLEGGLEPGGTEMKQFLLRPSFSRTS